MYKNGNVVASAIGLIIFCLLMLYIFTRSFCRSRIKNIRNAQGVIICRNNNEMSYKIYEGNSLFRWFYYVMFSRDITCYSISGAKWSRTNKSRNTFCAICLKVFSLADKILTLHCKHGFHGNCIMPWLTYNNKHTCPLCIRSIKLTKLCSSVNTVDVSIQGNLVLEPMGTPFYI